MIERSFANLTLETKENAPAGTFEGYGAVFGNTDRDGDIVAQGAFADSLKGRLPALLWQHNPKEPIGRFDVVREDKKGLYVKGRLSQTGRGAEAYELMKMGALDGLSIGFVTREAARNAATGTRTINKADLMEVSLVTFPANELARVASVKHTDSLSRSHAMPNAQIEDPRSFERFLRENGFSRSRAKTITAKGFRCDGGAGEIASLINEVKAKQSLLTGKISLDIEMKDFNKLVVPAVTSDFNSTWFSFRSFTVDQPSQFRLSYQAHGPRSGPFLLKVRYKSRNGLKEEIRPSHGIRNTPFLIPAGIHEVKVKAKSGAGFAQNILLVLHT